MGFLDRLAAGLAWLGRCGTTAVAVSILLGILLPPLGALIRPFFPETVFLLLCLAFLRVDPGALRAQHAQQPPNDARGLVARKCLLGDVVTPPAH